MAMPRAQLRGHGMAQQQYTQKQRGQGRCVGQGGTVTASGRTEGISPGASCGRGPASQPVPQSPALAPRCTCGDPGGPGSDTQAQRIPGEGEWSQSLGAKSSRALTRSRLVPGGCHRGPGSGAVPPSSPRRSPPGKEEQDNGNGGLSRCP